MNRLAASLLVFTTVGTILGLLIPGMRPHHRPAQRLHHLTHYRQPDEANPWAVVILGALAAAEVHCALPGSTSASAATLGSLLGGAYALSTALGWARVVYAVLGGIGVVATGIQVVEHVMAGGVLGAMWRAGSFFVVLAAFTAGRAIRPRKARPSLTGLTWFALADTIAFLTAPGGILPTQTGPATHIVIITISALAAALLGAVAPAMAIGLLAVGATVATLSMGVTGLIPATDTYIALALATCAAVTWFITRVIFSPLPSSRR